MPATAAQKRILQTLQALYPDARPELHFTNPYETLVSVMLSAQSTDVQVNKATPALFARYPTVADLAAFSGRGVAKQLMRLQPGEAMVSMRQATDPSFVERAQRVRLRPSCIRAGGETLQTR